MQRGRVMGRARMPRAAMRSRPQDRGPRQASGNCEHVKREQCILRTMVYRKCIPSPLLSHPHHSHSRVARGACELNQITECQK